MMRWPPVAGAAAGLQTALVLPQRRVLPLPGGAEGGRAPLHHHRPAERQPPDQEKVSALNPLAPRRTQVSPFTEI